MEIPPDYELHQFANGIRLVHKQVPHTKIAHCGFVLDMGSRDETESQAGLAHFWEHMAFKGTEKRRSFHILNRLERVGGELNAYTTKEKVTFYASFLDIHYRMAAELLTDITFHSVFPEKEIEKERSVILEEMAMYRDVPDDAIADEFDALLFEGHSLGYNILGTTETVGRFGREDFKQFIREHLDTGRIIFSSVGNLTMRQVMQIMGPLLESIPAMYSTRRRQPFVESKIAQVRNEIKPINQAHCMMGALAPTVSDPRRLPYFMLVNLLGGPAMNSRLNMALRERRGYVYGVEASFTPFTDTGEMAIYFGTEKKQLQRCIDLVKREVRLLRQKPLGKSQLIQAKEQLMGQLAMAEESNLNLMLMLGKSLLDAERVESLSEIFAQIKRITESQLSDLANELLLEESFSILTYQPE